MPIAYATPNIENHATDHAANDCIGTGVMEFTNIFTPGNNEVVITDIVVTDIAKNLTGLELWLFSENPSTGSTLVDNSAVNIASTYVGKHRRIIEIQTTDWIDAGGYAIAIPEFDKFVVQQSSLINSIFGILVARGARNQTGVGNILVQICGV